MAFRPLCVVIAGGSDAVCREYEAFFSKLGLTVGGSCSHGSGLAELIRSAKPDVILATTNVPGENVVETTIACWASTPAPIVLITEDGKLPPWIQADPVFGILHTPLVESAVEATLTIARYQFQRMRELESDLAATQQALQDRKLIERAKGVLMKHAGLDEPAAYQRLRKLSWDRNEKMGQVAQIILMAGLALDGAALPGDATNGNGDGHATMKSL